MAMVITKVITITILITMVTRVVAIIMIIIIIIIVLARKIRVCSRNTITSMNITNIRAMIMGIITMMGSAHMAINTKRMVKTPTLRWTQLDN
jgi:hypothetical protein